MNTPDIYRKLSYLREKKNALTRRFKEEIKFGGSYFRKRDLRWKIKKIDHDIENLKKEKKTDKKIEYVTKPLSDNRFMLVYKNWKNGNVSSLSTAHYVEWHDLKIQRICGFNTCYGYNDFVYMTPKYVYDDNVIGMLKFRSPWIVITCDLLYRYREKGKLKIKETYKGQLTLPISHMVENILPVCAGYDQAVDTYMKDGYVQFKRIVQNIKGRDKELDWIKEISPLTLYFMYKKNIVSEIIDDKNTIYKDTNVQTIDQLLAPGKMVRFIFVPKTWVNNIGKSFGSKLIIHTMEILSKDKV